MRLSENTVRPNIHRKSTIGRIADAIGVTYKWVANQAYVNGAPVDSVEAFSKWRAEFQAGMKARRLASQAHRRVPIEVQKRRASNKARIRRATPEHRARHAARMRAGKDKYRERYKTDPQFRIAHCLRVRTRKVLHGKIKSGGTLELIGCSRLELVSHLERQFLRGMNWDNFGVRWQIDHVQPLASFDLSRPEHQRQAFHFTNLQPLWKEDNLAKGDRVPVSQLPLLLPA